MCATTITITITTTTNVFNRAGQPLRQQGCSNASIAGVLAERHCALSAGTGCSRLREAGGALDVQQEGSGAITAHTSLGRIILNCKHGSHGACIIITTTITTTSRPAHKHSSISHVSGSCLDQPNGSSSGVIGIGRMQTVTSRLAVPGPRP
jgi:hypothetical protein